MSFSIEIKVRLFHPAEDDLTKRRALRVTKCREADTPKRPCLEWSTLLGRATNPLSSTEVSTLGCSVELAIGHSSCTLMSACNLTPYILSAHVSTPYLRGSRKAGWFEGYDVNVQPTDPARGEQTTIRCLYLSTRGFSSLKRLSRPVSSWFMEHV